MGWLANKKVKIVSQSFAGLKGETYKGVVVSVTQDGHCSFIELDSGVLVNTIYIESITVLD